MLISCCPPVIMLWQLKTWSCVSLIRFVLLAAGLLAVIACAAEQPSAEAPSPFPLPSLPALVPDSLPATATPVAVADTPPMGTADLAGASATSIAMPSDTDTEVIVVSAETAERTRRRFEESLRAEWATDFMRATIDYADIMTGGPPKDGIPAIDAPQFESVADADRWLDDREPVQAVNLNGDARAYPVQVMVWHELVNDVVGGEPVVITF